MVTGRKLITPPATEPITVTEAQRHLIVDCDDALLAGLIESAREIVESRTRRQLVTATWEMMLTRFPWGSSRIDLPLSPLLAVASVKYTDTAGDQQTLDAAEYVVDDSVLPATITPAYALTWPSVRVGPQAVVVNYTAGYGTAADVPEIAKAAIKMIVADLYENREAQSGVALKLNETVERLLGPLIVPELP